MPSKRNRKYIGLALAGLLAVLLGYFLSATVARSKSGILSAIIAPLHGRVYVDNPTDDDMTVFIDDHRRGNLGPRDIAVFDVRPGVHAFALYRGQEQYDATTGRVAMHHEHAFAPAGSSGFYLIAQKYTPDNRLITWGVGQLHHQLAGEKWLTSPERDVDVGLFEGLPDTVAVSASKGAAYRTKLFKALSGAPGPREASLALGINRHAYAFTDKLEALDAFAATPAAAEYVDLIFECMERDPVLAERCSAILRPYITRDHRPRIQRMLDRIIKREARVADGFDGVIALWAAQAEPADMVALYEKAPETRRPALLEAAAAAPAPLRREFIGHLMRQPPSERNVGWVLRLAADDKLVGDMAFVQAMDAWLAALPDPGKYTQTWSRIILHHVSGAAEPAVFERVAALCRQDDYALRGAVTVLINNGQADLLARDFTALSATARDALFEWLGTPSALASPALIVLARACLPDEALRRRFLETMTAYGRYPGDNPELLAILTGIIANETDAERQRSMGERFAQSLWTTDWQTSPAPEDLVAAMLIYGDRNLSYRVFDNLFMQQDRRDAVWGFLRKIRTDIPLSAVRLDLIFRAALQKIPDYAGFLRECLADVDAEVRFTAFEKLARLLRRDQNVITDESRQLLVVLQAAVAAEPDVETRRKMEALLKLWQVDTKAASDLQKTAPLSPAGG